MHRPTHTALAACLLLLAVLATSCLPTAPAAALAQSSTPRATSPQADTAAVNQTAQGISAFGFDLYRSLVQQEGGNVFFSPYSLSAALAMVYAGARGETERQMATTLHYTLPQEQLHPALNALDLSLMAPNQPFTLTAANAAWGQEGYKFRPAYLDVLAVNYGAGVRLANFAQGDSREAARQAINAWAKDRTAGKIADLISQDLLNEYTRLVLANAVYFKADWDKPFEARKTLPGAFTRADGPQVSVPMMHQRMSVAYAKGPDYQAVELPYKSGRMRMDAILPAAGQMADFERTLDAARLAAILGAMKPTDLLLSVPKFKFESSYKLAQPLRGMGMADVFDPAKADLSGMYEPGQQPLFLAHVVQKTFVAVDEKGTEAAAASAALVEAASMPQSLAFDRPFIFVIRDSVTGAVLFLGRLSDPTVS